MKLNNYKVFSLQQTNWFCDNCTNKNNQIICNCCNSTISVATDRFEICKNCVLPTHYECLFNKTCLLCIPEFKPANTYIMCDTNYNDNPLVDINLSELPYFTPFNDIDIKTDK